MAARLRLYRVAFGLRGTRDESTLRAARCECPKSELPSIGGQASRRIASPFQDGPSKGDLMVRICRVMGVILASALSSSALLAEPVRIDPAGRISQPRQPQAAVRSDGQLYVTFGARDAIYCAVSRDSGNTFTEPVKVAELRGLMLGMRRGPRIAAGAESAVVTAIGGDGDLLAWRSDDRGASWSGPARVNSVPTSAREGLHAMAIGPNDELFCVWLDLRNKKSELFGAASTDGGRSWSENRLIYRSPSGTVCECCHPSVAFDSGGAIHVMWRNSLDGNRDLYITRSPGIGGEFEQAAKLGTGEWPLDACPMDGGSLAVTADKVTTVWRRKKEIFRTLPGQAREERLGSGEQPWAVGTERGAWLVWISRRPGDLWLVQPGQNRPAKLATNATDPMVSAPLTARGPVVVVWEAGRGKETAIFASIVAAE